MQGTARLETRYAAGGEVRMAWRGTDRRKQTVSFRGALRGEKPLRRKAVKGPR